VGDEAVVEEDELVPIPDDWTMDDVRSFCDYLSDQKDDWQGVPVPLDDYDLRLCEGHPLQEVYGSPQPSVRVVVGGPPHDDISDNATVGEIVRSCNIDWAGERLVNQWYDGAHNRDVLIFQRANGRAFAVKAPRAPDRSMDRLTMALRTIGASDAWSLEAEFRAIDKLTTHVTERQLRSYMLTGSFVEMSKRSGVFYMFRRLRPTVALTGTHKWWKPEHLVDGEASLRVLTVLCLHPIGYYEKTWAGCMVPTDDVLAHLLMVRADEHLFWRKANHHDPASPEAGL
jgi:hypothetical protein